MVRTRDNLNTESEWTGIVIALRKNNAVIYRVLVVTSRCSRFIIVGNIKFVFVYSARSGFLTRKCRTIGFVRDHCCFNHTHVYTTDSYCLVLITTRRNVWFDNYGTQNHRWIKEVQMTTVIILIDVSCRNRKVSAQRASWDKSRF